MPPFIYVIAAVAFTSTLFVRMTDPIVPQIAGHFAMDVQTVAILGTAFALPWALMQPILGPVGDLVGKVRVITACLAVLSIAGLAGALAPNFNTLLASRILSGMAGGGVFPVAIALVSDHTAMQSRQIAISRLILGSVIGMLGGALLAGILADFVNWRGVFFVVSAANAISAIAAWYALRGIEAQTKPHFNLSEAAENYRRVFSNPRAKYCYGAVFIEGVILFGLFPYVALLLAQIGEPRASIAGIVVAGFGMGGVLYALSVGRLIVHLGPKGLMVVGGLIAAGALALEASLPPWPLQLTALITMGLGFFMLHGSIQAQMTELAPQARGTAVAGHAFFYFLGQALGPLAYLVGFSILGPTLWLLVGASLIAGLGLIAPRFILPSKTPGP